MKLLYFLFIVLLLSACSNRELAYKQKNTAKESINAQKEILDLTSIPQAADFYTKDINKDKLTNQNFLEHYFSAWNIDNVSIDIQEAKWAHNVYKYGDSYAENLRLIEEVFFDEMLHNANFEEYATVNKKAVTVNLLNIRAFPTNRPVLRDPQKAGEGFPFDYMQNSTVAANKPIIVSHYSKDREWAFIQTGFAFGWVKAKDIVYIPKKYIDEWKKAEQIILTQEGIPLFSQKGEFLFKSRIGMLLALISEDSESYTVLTVQNKKDSKAYYQPSKILKKYAHKGPLAFNANNINKIIKELQKSNYGWGGLYGQRDCSSTLRDFYLPFGLWLPRNSFMQANQGSSISLEDLNDKEKIETIKKNGIPFETLLYKQGHIVLYAGTFKDEVVVFQNVWGVKTNINGKEGRHIIGKTIFSGLEVGNNLKNYDREASLLVKMKSMSFPTLEN